MGWLKRLLGREQDHAKWLAAHPGKEPGKSAPPIVSAEEDGRTRANMEHELDEQRSKRGQQ